MTTLSDSCPTSVTARNGSPSNELQSPIASSRAKNSISEVFAAHNGRLIDKWTHYFPIYQRHFERFQDKPVRILEIGVSHGGSLQFWKEYFGPQAHILGLDINIDCIGLAEPQIHVISGDQANPDHLAKIAALGPFDIVIDDGSHYTADQEASFKALWGVTSGVYLIEDCHSGYPAIQASDALRYKYPWVLVFERPKRVIRGKPSFELRPDEIDAINLYSDV